MEGSQAGQIAAAAAGGACSAVISGPAELVMIQQQKHGGGLGETAARLFRERGLAGMYRGVVRNPGLWRCQSKPHANCAITSKLRCSTGSCIR